MGTDNQPRTSMSVRHNGKQPSAHAKRQRLPAGRRGGRSLAPTRPRLSSWGQEVPETGRVSMGRRIDITPASLLGQTPRRHWRSGTSFQTLKNFMKPTVMVCTVAIMTSCKRQPSHLFAPEPLPGPTRRRQSRLADLSALNRHNSLPRLTPQISFRHVPATKTVMRVFHRQAMMLPPQANCYKRKSLLAEVPHPRFNLLGTAWFLQTKRPLGLCPRSVPWAASVTSRV